MADNGLWFKLWIGADEDPDLGNLLLDDFARWCKFGLYLKKYGTDGTVTLKEPCYPLQHKFKVPTFQDVLDVIRKFPNCDVSGETVATVTWKNWQRYQGDMSTERVRKYRARETAKKRREENEKENKNKEASAAIAAPQKVKELRAQTEVDPLVHLAAEIGALATDRREGQQKLCQWTISMVRALKGEPPERVNAVVRASLERVREKFQAGYDVKNLWGLLDHIFKAERTKYIQGSEHQKNKNAPIGRFGEILDKIRAEAK